MLLLNLSYWQGVPLCKRCNVFFPMAPFKTCKRCIEWSRDNKKTRVANGICLGCSQPAVPGKKRCEDCAEKQRKRWALRKERGICYSCPDAAEEGKSYCRKCLDAIRDNAQEVPEGLCVECHKRDARPGLSTCERCVARRATNKENKIKKGICAHCSRPVPYHRRLKGLKYCAHCSKITNQSVARRRESRLVLGMCVVHPDRPVAPNNRYRCVECADAKKKYNQDRRTEHKAKGLCVWCGKKPNNGKGDFCDEHAARTKKIRQKTDKRRRGVKRKGEELESDHEEQQDEED